MAHTFATNDSQALTELADGLDRLQTTDDKLELVKSYTKSRLGGLHSTSPKSVAVMAGNFKNTLGGSDNDQISTDLTSVLDKHGLRTAYCDWFLDSEHLKEKEVLERLPCAHVVPANNWRCSENGTQACGACQLVSYCSKVSTYEFNTLSCVSSCCRRASANTGAYTNEVSMATCIRSELVLTFF